MLIADALDAVAARLKTISGLTVTTDPGVGVAAPMALVTDGEMGYHASFGRGHDELAIRITVYVSRADSGEGMLEARAYKSGHGAKSIRAAIETSAGTGDTVPNATFTAVTSETGIRTNGDLSYIALDVDVVALIPGS